MVAQDGGALDSVGEWMVPIHPDGHKFLAAAVLAAVVAYFLSSTAFWICLALAVWLMVFFRDPARVTPLREGLVVAPADGRIVAIETVEPPAEMVLEPGRRVRISIALSLLDVHVNRAPVPGRIVRSIYLPGAFFNPTLDKASEDNERRVLVIDTAAGAEVAIAQIAGQLSRRIVTFAGEGDTVGVGQRFGLIRFGSRVDLYLPPGHAALALVGQRTVAGETVIADLKSDEPEREGRRS